MIEKTILEKLRKKLKSGEVRITIEEYYELLKSIMETGNYILKFSSVANYDSSISHYVHYDIEDLTFNDKNEILLKGDCLISCEKKMDKITISRNLNKSIQMKDNIYGDSCIIEFKYDIWNKEDREIEMKKDKDEKIRKENFLKSLNRESEKNVKNKLLFQKIIKIMTKCKQSIREIEYKGMDIGNDISKVECFISDFDNDNLYLTIKEREIEWTGWISEENKEILSHGEYEIKLKLENIDNIRICKDNNAYLTKIICSTKTSLEKSVDYLTITVNLDYRQHDSGTVYELLKENICPMCLSELTLYTNNNEKISSIKYCSKCNYSHMN